MTLLFAVGVWVAIIWFAAFFALVGCTIAIALWDRLWDRNAVKRVTALTDRDFERESSRLILEALYAAPASDHDD
jgi:hypothetical protein